MNAEAIKDRLRAYYQAATPEQVAGELAALGVEFEDYIEPNSIRYVVLTTSLVLEYSGTFQAWQSPFLVKTEENLFLTEKTLPKNNGKSAVNNYQFAMAA